MAFDETYWKLQQGMKVGKTENNNFGHYTYRTAEGILKKFRELISDDELKATLTIVDEPLVIEGWHYIKSKIILATENGEYTASAFARESEAKKGMDPAQVTGATISYARKYALGGLFAISDEIDLDDPNYQAQGQSQAPTSKVEQQKNKQIAANRQNYAGIVKQISLLAKLPEDEINNQIKARVQSKPELAAIKDPLGKSNVYAREAQAYLDEVKASGAV
ncbi:hypothetical protein SN811_01460 [Ligilactobacillus agilis]|uniref:Recombinase n=1 Tax=Ligilactobacillus agilis TaxID=1601 RepID=A0A6F9Y2B1_9LACO|nr:ERF family protein [Ligilactobacillus agilis]GET11646.1 hypothetical protein SN811_01460 [Ligilactobacillus agilis]